MRSNDPRGAWIGALAGVTPTLMLFAWIQITGWSGDSNQLVVAIFLLGAVAVAAGAIVGPRIGPGLRASLVGVIAYALVGWCIYVPVGVIGSTVQGIADGTFRDITALVGSVVGYLAYALVTSLYVWIFLVPFGIGWILTVRILERSVGRRPTESAPASETPPTAVARSSDETESPRVATGRRRMWVSWLLGISLGMFAGGGILVAGVFGFLLLVLSAVWAGREKARPLGLGGLLIGLGAGSAGLLVLANARCAASNVTVSDHFSGCVAPDLTPWFVAAAVSAVIGVAVSLLGIPRAGVARHLTCSRPRFSRKREVFLRRQPVGSAMNEPSAAATATNSGDPRSTATSHVASR